MRSVTRILRDLLANAPASVTSEEAEWLISNIHLIGDKPYPATTPTPMTQEQQEWLESNAQVIAAAFGIDGPLHTGESPRTFVDCHLELRNLEADEVCGRCGQRAGDHRLHKSNRPRV